MKNLDEEVKKDMRLSREAIEIDVKWATIHINKGQIVITTRIDRPHKVETHDSASREAGKLSGTWTKITK